MAEEKNLQTADTPDFKQFYTVMHGYIEYCIRDTRKKLSDKEKEGLSPEEIAKKEEELKEIIEKNNEESKNFQKTYENMCDAISKGGIPYLSTYVDALKKLYEDNSDWKRDIKTALVSEKSLELFREARNNIIDLYPILVTVNKTFPVDDYKEVSLSPKAAIYGSEVNKTKKGSVKKSPMKNEEIQDMLELFLQMKDYRRCGEWFVSILVFSSDQVVDGYEKEYIPKREELREWAYRQLETNDSYKCAVMDTLVKNKMFINLVDSFVAIPSMKKKQAELEDKIKSLEEENARETSVHEERRQKQYELIQERDAELQMLRQKLCDFDKCKMQLTRYIDKYKAQIDMNERITSDNERRIKEMEADYDHMQDELAEATSQLESIQSAHAALQSDFSLKNNELLRLKEMASQKEETARVDMMRELVAGINEQFFYLTKFYLELKDTGKLEPESIELYADTLSNIDSVLSDLGIKKIGVIDQKVEYDASLHISTDAKISNGEQVVVSGYGWKIGDEVYVKAPVEKGE